MKAIFLLLSLVPLVAFANPQAPVCKYPESAVNVPDLPTPGTIALTFDDGPNPDTTPHVLDILKKYGIKATFFLVGENIKDNTAIVKRTLKEGHNIGVHTWTHPHIPQISQHRMHVEIRETDQILKQFKNTRARVMRFPFGESTCAAEKYVESFHYNIVGWQIDSCDWSYGEGLEKSDCVDHELQTEFAKDYQGWIDHQLKETGGGIILMHDAEQYESDHLEAEILHLKSQGYKFIELDRGGYFPKLMNQVQWTK